LVLCAEHLRVLTCLFPESSQGLRDVEEKQWARSQRVPRFEFHHGIPVARHRVQRPAGLEVLAGFRHVRRAGGEQREHEKHGGQVTLPVHPVIRVCFVVDVSAHLNGSPGRFGRYRLLGPIATGGMAVVYRAVLEGPAGFARPLAIKRIRPELSRDQAFRTMLLDEAQLSAQLRHPNIVQVVECGEANGELYIAMELIEGSDLRSIINRSRQLNRSIPAALCAHLVASVATALNYAHTLEGTEGVLHLVHRDISPTNIMVTQQGIAKLLDFGIAKAAVMLRDEQTRTGVVKGKFAYMSPEQAGGESLDARSDLFSLGAVLYEMLTLRPAFGGANDLATLRLVREAAVAPVSSLVPALDPRWDAVLARLLAPRPEHRVPSGAEAERALLALSEGANAADVRDFIATLELSPGSSPLPPTGSAFAQVAYPSASIAELEAASPRRPHRWKVVLAAVGVVVAAGSVAGTLLLRTPEIPGAQSQAFADATAAVAPVVESLPLVKVPDPSPPAQVPAREAMSTVVLEIRGTPGARVAIDGQSAGRTPLLINLPVRSGNRTVRVQSAGFEPYERRVPANSSVLLEPSLKRVIRKPGPSRPTEVPDPFR
jgi:eukaryotic-like serine/threonine-protein kinase